MTPLPGGFQVDYRLIPSLKALLALVAFALLLFDWWLGNRASARWMRVRGLALAGLGVLSLAAWWNFGALLGPGRPLHLHDYFHYYIGSKYFAELGYTRIYQCTAVAEMERGRSKQVAERWTRNLETNYLERHLPTRAEIDDCLSRFGEHWAEFGSDVEWFRGHMRRDAWNGVMMVFGHNATPVWNAMGHWLTRGRPASNAQILALAALDPLLILLVCLMAWRTFGWQAASVAAAWWGLSEPVGYNWMGGAFLRQDLLFCVVGAVCALRTGRNALAGAALGTAILLRAFPLFLLAGLGVKMLADLRARGPRETLVAYRGFLAGLSIAGLVLLTLGTLAWRQQGEGPLEPWKGFAANSRKHVDTPISTHLGLKSALWFSPDTRAATLADFWVEGPWDSWADAHTTTARSRKPVYLAIVALFAVLFWSAVRRAENWVALAASVTVLPFASNLANYYYAVLLVCGFLWPIDKPIGIGLVALSAFTRVLPVLLDHQDDRATVVSAAVVLYAFFVILRLRSLARRPAPAPALVESAATPKAVM